MDQQPIGFFDSGVGGLSVWREVVNLLPQESTLYFADQAFFPYGEKPATVIRQRMLQICCFLLKRKAKLIVIACNTATVSGIDRLRRQFKLPLIGVEPAIKSAVARQVKKVRQFREVSKLPGSQSYSDPGSDLYLRSGKWFCGKIKG